MEGLLRRRPAGLPPGYRDWAVGATLAHSAWSRRVVKVVAIAVSDERRVVQMVPSGASSASSAARVSGERSIIVTIA
jgi:hypothetical protein